jgi:hypothetical protein
LILIVLRKVGRWNDVFAALGRLGLGWINQWDRILERVIELIAELILETDIAVTLLAGHMRPGNPTTAAMAKERGISISLTLFLKLTLSLVTHGSALLIEVSWFLP